MIFLWFLLVFEISIWDSFCFISISRFQHCGCDGSVCASSYPPWKEMPLSLLWLGKDKRELVPTCAQCETEWSFQQKSKASFRVPESARVPFTLQSCCLQQFKPLDYIFHLLQICQGKRKYLLIPGKELQSPQYKVYSWLGQRILNATRGKWLALVSFV